jgi:predicted dehydrogenase
MWLIGEVDAVTADIKVVTGRYGDCDETGEALIEFKNGVIGTLAAGWVDVDDPVQLLISGTEAHAVIVNDKLSYQKKNEPGTDGRYIILPSMLPLPSLLPLDQFVYAVAGQKHQPLVIPQEAAARVAVMEAMYKAARERKWVKVG